MTHKPAPIALTIAGSDSGGGAGIQADLKTFSALGAYGASVITALTAQNTRAVTMVEEASPAMVRAQLAAVFDDLAVAAMKIGMLASVDIIEAVAAGLEGREQPIVLDPVMVAKTGDALLRDDAVAALRGRLVPLCTVLTPNLPEAARLLAAEPARNEREMIEQGRALLETGPRAVLMKGGHARGASCVDLLVEHGGVTRLEAPRIETRNTHGTGCTLSAAMAAWLAHGAPLAEATTRAHAWLQEAIRAADRLRVGSGHGPVHHFHGVWTDG
ncbi:MAG: bifunctional hydroxymethylpyrimidine kinase/phosphomethylpyrimidine kinase [Burkholderiaceae bacterium]